MNVIQEMRRVH